MSNSIDKSKKKGISLQALLALVGVGYGASPLDVVPDFIPALGYLDDSAVIVVCLTLIVLATLADRGGQNNG